MAPPGFWGGKPHCTGSWGASSARPSKCWQPPVSACPGHPRGLTLGGRWRRSLRPQPLPPPQACSTPSRRPPSGPVLLNPILALVPAPTLSLLLVLTRRFPAHLLAPLLPQTHLSLVATEHEHLLKPQGPHLLGVRSALLRDCSVHSSHPPRHLAVAF